MIEKKLFTRRDVLKQAAVSAVAFSSLAVSPRLAAGTPPASPPSRPPSSFKLSVATISLRRLAPAAVAAVLNQLQIDHVSIFREHAPFETGTPDECRTTADIFRAAGLIPAATSVVTFTNDETSARRAFENTRAAGVPILTCSPAPDSLLLLEKLAREYDLRLAIHNHGPEDKVYPSPYEALKLIESLDPRIGLCLDVGHCMRAGVDPVEAIHRCAARTYDFHLKDSLALPGAPDIPTEVGRGRMDIPGILAALIETKYAGVVAFEYERENVNPAIGLAESVGYVRGVLRTI